MSGGHDDVIEHFVRFSVVRNVLSDDPKFSGRVVVFDPPHGVAESDEIADSGFLDPSYDVVVQNSSRRVGCNVLSEVLFECVIGEFQSLFRSV